MHHGDHGASQYTSIDFGRTLRTCWVVSMRSVGDAFDNAMAESFVATLTEEMITDGPG